MAAYTLQRILLAFVIIAMAVTTLFVLVQAVPGDPASVMLGPRATPEMKQALRAKMRLDQPVYIQIYYFSSGLLRGDLGTDVLTNKPVLDIVMTQFPHTLALVGSALLIALLGIPLGVFSALSRNSFLDRFIGVLSVSLIAVPVVVVALALLLIFAVKLRWFPAIGAGEPGDLVDMLWHLVLPAFAIGLSWIGYIARLVRASMLEILNQSHVMIANAFGLPHWTIVRRYVLRIAILPTITVLGISIGYILSAAVITEIIFARPGIGKLIYDSVISRNYPLVMGSVLFSTVFIVFGTTLSDLLSALLDPRARKE